MSQSYDVIAEAILSIVTSVASQHNSLIYNPLDQASDDE